MTRQCHSFGVKVRACAAESIDVTTTFTATRRGNALACLTLTALVLTGCQGSSDQAIEATPVAAEVGDAAPAPSPASSPTPTGEPKGAPAQPGPDLRTALQAARDWSGTAVYRLEPRDDAPDARVTVVRTADRVRVDVAVGGLTSTLMPAKEGWVACAATESAKEKDRTTCVLAANPDADLPAAFDPGVGHLMSSVVPGLSGRTDARRDGGRLVARSDVAAAACIDVRSGDDSGEYCVTGDGVLRRASFPSGVLTLTSASDKVDHTAFTPPVKPVTLG